MSKAVIPRDPSNPAYQYIPADLADVIPRFGSGTNDDVDDPIAHVKLFTPDSSWTWYITEYDPVDRICFGLVLGLETEFGTFSLQELEDLRGPHGLPIERDLYWKPRPVSECQSD